MENRGWPEDYELWMAHGRMTKASEAMSLYLESHQIDAAKLDSLWKELSEARKELWALVDCRRKIR